MCKFLLQHASSVIGMLSGWDRLRLRGTLRSIAYPDALGRFLSCTKRMLKGFGAFAEESSRQVRSAALAVADQAGRPTEYLPNPGVSKEQVARTIAGRDGIGQGLICAVTAVEPCWSFALGKDPASGHIELKNAYRKCLHVYHYHLHPVFGFMHVRLQTWLPGRDAVPGPAGPAARRQQPPQRPPRDRQRRQGAARGDPHQAPPAGQLGEDVQQAGVGPAGGDDAEQHAGAEEPPAGKRQGRLEADAQGRRRRRAKVSDSANRRYLDAMAAVAAPTPLKDLTRPLAEPATLQGRRARGLNLLGEADATLLAAVGRGEFLINGLRNRDLQAALYPDATDDPALRRRRSGQVTRRLRLLRAHGLIKKVPHTHRYLVTEKGREVITALLAAREADAAKLAKAA